MRGPTFVNIEQEHGAINYYGPPETGRPRAAQEPIERAYGIRR